MNILNIIYDIISRLLIMLDNTDPFNLGFSILDFFVSFLIISTVLTLLISRVHNSQKID